MDIVTFKLQEDIIRKIDDFVEPLHYSNRTEFIREAIRDKINLIEKNLFLTELEKFKGSSKAKVSDEALNKIRDETAKKYAKKFGIKLD